MCINQCKRALLFRFRGAKTLNQPLHLPFATADSICSIGSFLDFLHRISSIYDGIDNIYLENFIACAQVFVQTLLENRRKFIQGIFVRISIHKNGSCSFYTKRLVQQEFKAARFLRMQASGPPLVKALENQSDFC
ncbi:hypothetical protein [Thiolapillus sp.]